MMDAYSRVLALMKKDSNLCRFSNNNEYLSLCVYLYFNDLTYISNAVALQSRYINLYCTDKETELYRT